jgi:choline kinase
MPLTADRPKALVEVAGRSLLARLVEVCASAGMREAIVVTGYKQEAIDAVSGSLALPVRTVFNDAFDTLGNAWSLYVAREAIGERDFVKFDGDVALDAQIVEDLLSDSAPSAIVLDRHVELDEEAMKATADDGRVTALGKWLDVADSSGESIGVEKIAAADAPALFEQIAAIVKTHPNAYYEDAYHQLVANGWRLGVVGTRGLAWSEVDDARDLERATAWLG